jgi:HEAT repeat protein
VRYDVKTNPKVVAALSIALMILSGCGKPPPELARRKWTEALRDPDPKLRKRAAFKLGNIGLADRDVVPALIGALKDADSTVRCEAILSLMKIGPDAEEAIPELANIQEHDSDEAARTCAARALEKLHDSQ